MAINSEILKNFESILKENASNQLPILYSGNKHVSKNLLDVDQVICNVSRQIKAIQNADYHKNSKAAAVNISKYKKSSFIPVDMLDGAESMPQNTNSNKFETQCVTDTQLINIAQNAEELVSHRGMTQEFDITFCTQEANISSVQIVTDNDDLNKIADVERDNNNLVNKKEPVFSIIDISLKEPDRADDFDSLFDEDENIEQQVFMETENQPRNDTPENKSLVDKNTRLNDSDDRDLSSSPVFNVKVVKKSTTLTPLVFELEAFEKFEKIALPIVEKNTDQVTAKCLIDSQILGKELCLQSESKLVLFENEQEVSPLIEWSKNKFQLDQVVQYLPVQDKSVSESKSSQISILKDEILFSSDEENEYGLQEYNFDDLPFTCALATSFYEQPSVLDKTMYVGFQTASNKSIQISTESFYKAKSILDDFKTDVSDKQSLTELVKICDGENSTAVKDSMKIDSNISITNNMNTVFRGSTEFHDCKDGKTTSENELVNQLPTLRDLSEKSVEISQKHEGLKIASNIKIYLSEKDLEQSKNFFKDIDLNENNIENKTTPGHEHVNELPLLRDFSERSIEISQTFGGLKTASNKKIHLSEKDLQETKIFFKEIGLNDNYKDDKTTLRNLSEKPVNICQTFEGFKTASNKKICLSEKALQRSKKIFKDIDLNENDNCELITIKEELTDKYTEYKIKENSILQKDTVKDKKELNLDESILLEFENNDMSHENVNKYKTVNLVGFKTASNKNIKISNAALEKSKKIFQDIEYPENVNDTRATKTDLIECFKQTIIGFKTASNKEIKISAQALAKTKSLFSDIEVLEGKDADFEYTEKPVSDINLGKDIWDQPSTSKTPFEGFKTASNKKIKVSDDALATTKKIFEDISSNDVLNENNICLVKSKSEYPNKVTKKRSFDDIIDRNDNTENTLKTYDFIGFQTASNKRIKISEEALMKSHNIIEEIDKNAIGEDIDDELFKNMESNINSTKFKGFLTASKKPIIISKDAMENSKAIFEKIDDVNNDNQNSKICRSPTKFKSIKTASNEPRKVTEQALFKINKFFENIDKNFDVTEIKGDNSTKGFKTASDKFITISEDALAKSKKVFENIDDVKDQTTFKYIQTEDNLVRSKKMFEDIDLDPERINIEKSTKFKGFQTASNKKVNISAQALARSRKILENIDVETKPVETLNKGTFQGFQTASNKKVNISETALTRSKKIFQDISTNVDLDETDILKNNTYQESLPEHQKKTNISEQALAKSRLLKNNDAEKCIFKSPTGSSFRGFHTASDKVVKISKESLAKTKGVFQTIDIPFETVENTADLAISQVIPVKSVKNNIQNMSKDSLKESKNNLTDFIYKIPDKQTECDTNEHLAKMISANLTKDIVNTENVIDTQVINDFDRSLHTEDFSKAITPAKLKRSGIVIDTQVINDFDKSLHIEDFSNATTPVKSKRSGSPILSCPKAKRRKKFETPYNKTQKNIVIPAHVEDINKNNDIKPQTHIFDQNYKITKKYNLSDIHNMEKVNSDTRNSIDPYIMQHSFENLLSFEFFGPRNELSNERWTTDDLKKYFLKSVNKNFVPDGWIENHLRLIIWKLISYEIKFPKTLGIVCTSKNVIEQLKYRYDKELFNSERPALRKILEKDDVSTKLMVLCVVAVYQDGADMDKVANQKTVELLLTDGWYCIRARLDRMLRKLVEDGKIVVGGKIVTSGAELTGCEQGMAPWEDTSQVRLKLSGNSTRRARWPTRLGYHGNGAILNRLRDVTPDGGRVARLRVLVARVYPTLYIEKFDDGSTVTRSERLEVLHQMKYENERQGLLEKLYEDVQKEFPDVESQDSEVDTGLKGSLLESGSQIAIAMKNSRDPPEFRSNLSETQVDLLNDHTTRKRDRLIQDVQARVEERIAESGLDVRRNVVPLMKIRIADVSERESVEVTRGLMSIWKPNDAVLEIVKEGTWIEVLNVTPTAIRYSEIQISAGRQSIFCQSKHKEIEKFNPYIKSLKRICYPIKDLAKNPCMTTEYNEIDTVGLIVLIEPSIKEFDSNKNQFQNMYLSDNDKNLICVNFWGGLKKLGFENILDTGEIVACMNLQKRAGNTRKNIPQYRVTEFSHFTKTPKNDIARNICDDLEKKLQGVDRMQFCDDCVSLKNNYSVYKMQNYNENVSPYRFQNIDLNLSKNTMYIDSPLAAKVVKHDENLNLSGLDFESTFKQVDTQEYSPKTMLRKRQIKEKIDKLKMYGEPPALSPIQILNKSKNAGGAFKSPLPKSEVSKSVASAGEILLKEENLESIENPGSPVIMNRTFVKRTNVNPVKLDFDSVAINNSSVSDTFDHFAEEFDGSPPLSLD